MTILDPTEPLIVLDQVTYKTKHNGLSVGSEDRIILENIQLSIRPGEIKTIIGPNGAGKSTLVKILIGLMKPTSGQVRYGSNVKIGYMPQTVQINPYLPLSVGDFLKLYGLLDHDTLTYLNISPLLNHSVHGLSGGQWQRVLFARALMNKPNVLVLDEPTQAVDYTGQQDFYKLLLDLKKTQHYAILMVSHDLHYVLSATDYVYCLNQHICCEGPPRDIQNHSAYQRLFGHTMHPYDVVPYQHVHDHCHDTGCSHAEHGDHPKGSVFWTLE
ncbi:MAG: metal ABC transporter ATP-binding protein [Alphaproteobacteria bacterium]|nr:metal ABC transporter ATP-binding protein [Alphaproteobacteria bacterium]